MDDKEPLLSTELTNSEPTNPISPFTCCWGACTTHGLRRAEIARILHMALPAMLSAIIQYTLGSVILAFVGKGLGSDELAAASMGSMLTNVTGLAFAWGLCTAMDTICAQANGANNFRMVGVALQRAAAICLVVCIPVGALWFNVEPILVALGQPPQVSRLAAEYMRYRFIGFYPAAIFEAQRKFFVAQGLTRPQLAVVCIVALFNPLCSWLLIVGPLKVGFRGAPITASLCDWLAVSLLAGYVQFIARDMHGKTWNGVSLRDAFSGWRSFLRLGFPGMCMMTASWLAFEGVSLAAGHLGTVPLASHAIVTQIVTICFMIPNGISVATASRIGNHLGGRRPLAARRAAWLGSVMGLVATILIGGVVLALRTHWAYIFTSTPAVITLASQVMWLAPLFLIVDGMQGVFGGILRGCGRQMVGAAVNMSCFYALAIPLALVLCFVVHLGLQGLWAGLICGMAVQCLIDVLYLSVRVNWMREVDRALKRADESARDEATRTLQNHVTTTHADFETTAAEDTDDEARDLVDAFERASLLSVNAAERASLVDVRPSRSHSFM